MKQLYSMRAIVNRTEKKKIEEYFLIFMYLVVSYK